LRFDAALALVLATSVHAAEDPAGKAVARIFPPPAVLERRTIELTDPQATRIEKEAGTAPPSRSVDSFVARTTDGGVAGYAYLDRHLVRTLEETLLVALDANARIVRVEVVEFREPPEYEPSPRWYAQFEGRTLAPDLQLKRGIRTLAGATLSSRAATDAVRRVLVLHASLHPTSSPTP
jgi:Na+-translocating ferredoxin:NAD+ oxidoreductase RnfG subunit